MRGTNCKIDCIFVDSHQNNDFSLGICWDGKKLCFQSEFGQKIENLRGKNEERKFGMHRKICANAWFLGSIESSKQGLSGNIIFLQKIALPF